MEFKKKQKTNNILLRWLANLCEKPANYHLKKFLSYSDRKDYGRICRFHAYLSYRLYKPYLRWGTFYEAVTDSDSVES